MITEALFMDPDGGDVLATFAMMVGGVTAITAGAVLAGIAYDNRVRAGRRFSIPKKVMQALLLIGVVLSLPEVLSIASRHFGTWRVVRDALRVEEARIQAELGERKVLTTEEFEKHAEQLSRRDLEFPLGQGTRNATIEMMSTVPPYVGLDFGHGSHGQYDTRTMFCVYGD